MKTQPNDPARLELKHLAAYLPYGLKCVLTQDFNEEYGSADFYEEGKFDKGCIWSLSGYADGNLYIPAGEGELDGFIYSDGSTYACFDREIKPILRPMSDLDKVIQYEHQSYAFTDLFEIGDDGGFNFEYDFGNIKLIQRLKTIAKYGIYNDVNYLPYPVVALMFEHHFDVLGLIPAGLAVDVNTLSDKP